MNFSLFRFSLPFALFSVDKQRHSLLNSNEKKKRKNKKETMRRVHFGPELVGRTSGRYAGYMFHSRNRSLVTWLLERVFSQFRDESSVSINDRSSDMTRHDDVSIWHFARSRNVAKTQRAVQCIVFFFLHHMRTTKCCLQIIILSK